MGQVTALVHVSVKMGRSCHLLISVTKIIPAFVFNVDVQKNAGALPTSMTISQSCNGVADGNYGCGGGEIVSPHCAVFMMSIYQRGNNGLINLINN